MENQDSSPAKKTAIKVIFEAFKILKDNCGQFRECLKEVKIDSLTC